MAMLNNQMVTIKHHQKKKIDFFFMTITDSYHLVQTLSNIISALVMDIFIAN